MILGPAPQGPSPTASTESCPTLERDSTIWPSLLNALLFQQLPKLQRRDNPDDGETFKELIGQLEMVASIGCWDDCTKLDYGGKRMLSTGSALNRKGVATTHLLQSLPQELRLFDFKQCKAAVFHDRKQKPNEPVDAYAQELRRLFYLAYPRAQQSLQEVEDMMNLVLVYQFVVGLQQELKVKLAGVDGIFDELWTKARFKEAKIQDLGVKSNAGRKPNLPPPPTQKGWRQASNQRRWTEVH